MSARPSALIVLLLFLSSCAEQDKTPSPAQTNSTAGTGPTSKPDSAEQISQYIRKVFQDREGNMWFGTTSDGVCRYDGRSLVYFTTADGLSSNWVNAIAQDPRGDLWFATGGGVSRYDGTRFTRYTTKDGLASDQVWCILQHRSGGFWFGTEEGVSRFDPSALPTGQAGSLSAGGRTFTDFPIPAADLSKFPYYKYPKQINAITEDKAGNIWFATNGGGAYRYDGSTLTNLSENDGLCNNFVQTIMEDRSGSLWFGTRYGGLCRYDGTAFTAVPANDVKGANVSTLYQDPTGIMWIGVTATGLCSYNGTAFTCYDEHDGPGIRVIMSVLQDASGQLWFGTGAGVYRFVAGKFTNWTKREALGG